jgi:probable rRNA maturation factor
VTEQAVTEDGEWSEYCTEADGLTLEISAPVDALDHGTDKIIASAIVAANAVAGPVRGTVAVLVDGDERLQALNRQWRGIDKPTNVLSFAGPDHPGGEGRHLGDIAISYQTAAREALAERKPLPDHLAHLSAHGFLHLLGYDHESDGDAETMERLERAILARVGVPDPYMARPAEG